MSGVNITIIDTSPIFTYSPFGEGGEAGASINYGWATGYLGSGFLANGSLPRGAIGTGYSYHATAFEGGSVSLKFNGTALYLYGAANCTYDVVLDSVTQTKTPSTTQDLLAFYQNLSMQSGHVVTIKPHPGTNEILYFEGAIVTTPTQTQTPTIITPQKETIVFSPSGSWGSPQKYGVPNPYHQVGASASLSFSGNTIAVYGGLNGQSTYTATLDGSAPQTFNGSTYWDINQTILYFQSGLSSSITHDLQLFTSDPQANITLTEILTWTRMTSELPPPRGGSPSGGTPKHRISIGIIIGPVIGVSCLLAAAAFGFWWFKIRPNRRRRAGDVSDDGPHDDLAYSIVQPPSPGTPSLTEFNPYDPQHTSGAGRKEPAEAVPARKRHALGLLVVPALALLAITGLVVTMMLWLLLHRRTPDATTPTSVTHGALIVDEASKWCDIVDADACNSDLAPSLLGLTLSGLLSKAVSFSVPFVLALAILSAAATWLRASATTQPIPNDLPTPLQYGLMISMAAGNASAALRGWKYLVLRREDCTKVPSFVKTTFASLVALLSLNLIISVADTWLHASTKPLKLNQTLLAPNTSSVLAGLALNANNACPNPTFDGTCVYENPVAEWGTSAQRSLGDQVAANYSYAPYQVMYLPTQGPGGDSTAVLLPKIKDLPSGISFTSMSIGIGATCGVIPLSQCNLGALGTNVGIASCTISGAVPSAAEDNLPGGVFSVYANSTFNVDSTDGAWIATYNLQQASQQTNSSVATAPSPLAWYGQSATNPFGLAHLMAFNAQPQGNPDFTVLQSGTTARGASIAYYLGTCNVSVYDVHLSYSNDTYTLLSRTLADQNTTVAMFGPFVTDYFYPYFLPTLVVNLKALITSDSSGTNFPMEVARQVSQLALAYGSAMFTGLAAQDGTVTKTYIASRYPLVALGLLWASALVYILYGLVLLFRAMAATGDEVIIPTTDDKKKETTISTLELAHARLVNPVAVVAERFLISDVEVAQCRSGGDGNVERLADVADLSVRRDPLDMFAEGRDGANGRLGVGFSSAVGGDGQLAIQKRIFRVAYSQGEEREQQVGYKQA
ncbi:hypothetical protein FRB93_007185 [Tulasnella sp. JGI-2019a]|nr:hypothetical protein FRB93_007185 [Tulasnella sp. JGI-2019a]